MNKGPIYVPVSLKLIQWTKDIVKDGIATKEDRQCYAHTTSRGRVMNIHGNELNTTTSCSINGVDISSQARGLSYAKWYWDMNEDMFNSFNDLGLCQCYMKVTYDGDLSNVIDEQLVTVEEYDGIQDKPSYDDYLSVQAV